MKTYLSFVLAGVALLMSITVPVSAADITIRPNGKTHNINGSTVLCAPSPINLSNKSDQVIQALAETGGLGVCSLTKSVGSAGQPDYWVVWRNGNIVLWTKDGSNTLADALTLLRELVKANACY